MSILEFPNPILLTPCEEVTEFGQDLKILAQNMIKTTYELKAVGLAANQIGVNKRICVMIVNKKEYILVNPSIVKSSGVSEDQEGCLSQPGIYKSIIRPMNVVIAFQDIHGNTRKKSLSGLAARCIFHELDHLNGKNPLQLG